MKIAIFTDSFLPGIGGTENAAHLYATALSVNNDVLLCAPDYKRENADKAYSYKVVRVKSLKFTSNDFWAMPSISSNLKRALDEFKPDVLHCQTLGTMAGYANKYGRKNGIPVVHTVHTKYRHCWINNLKSRFLAEIVIKNITRRANKADCVCTVSDSMIPELKSYGVKKDVTVIRNGYVEREIPKLDVTKRDIFKFVYVGLVIKYKNVGFTLRALSKVKEKRQDFIFTIVGAGPDVKYFKKLSKKLGIAENVEFTGVIKDRETLCRRYASSDLFLFPSIFDNDPLVVVESAIVGTPSLVLKGTGASERITDGENGFIVENDVQAYADKILELMSDRDKLLIVGERAKSVKFEPWSATVDKYEEIYKKPLQK